MWTVMIKFPEGLLVRVEEEAERRGMSTEQVIVDMVNDWFLMKRRERDEGRS